MGRQVFVGQPERTNGELLSAVAGNPDAFLGIFDRHFSAVHRFIVRQLGPPAAEDAAAEVFVRALRGANSFAPDATDARPWLLGIAANVIRGELRRRYRDVHQPLEAVEPLQAGLVDEGRLDAVGRLAEVRSALESIPLDDREPLLLYAWADLSYEEIAEALRLPIGTVRSRIARGRRRLRSELGSERLEAGPEGAYDR